MNKQWHIYDFHRLACLFKIQLTGALVPMSRASTLRVAAKLPALAFILSVVKGLD